MITSPLATGIDIVDLARTLADEFRPTAAELDRSGSFPTANYARMREAGYLRAPVPVELGGLGAGMLTMARSQQQLARAVADVLQGVLDPNGVAWSYFQPVGVGGVQAVSTSFKGFGTMLMFTPTVLDKDRIRLTVTPTFSTA